MKQTEEIPDLFVVPDSAGPSRIASRGRNLLSLATATAMVFIYAFALPYLTMEAARLGIYRPRREWLVVHIAGGIGALVIGPYQMWLGLNRRNAALHNVLGIGYVMSVAASSVSAFYLAFHNDFGWVFGMGLTMMAMAWVMTTSLAVASICMCMPEQHREWMTRSYVVTFGFVFFRLLVGIFETFQVGNITEQLSAASWFSWSIPLLFTEAILQSRKIFRSS